VAAFNQARAVLGTRRPQAALLPTPLAPPGAGSLPCNGCPLLLGKALGAGPASSLTE